ncbi:hypothetical protein AHAT_25250 [Agarivorans sp. Toyoura001]|uniref:DUF1826 domain-containing protein n=1 Tax=Agarivorans sp. Toyoura001 TaxID=2283141 RepID=UPI0010F238FE|nr:DUF1826 domain-containing protein [Agarivorans sp. Toyoura001]GDY26635.1 hypothetical protein AHAT_25250 [Agarivorans sp. Toyoura001]
MNMPTATPVVNTGATAQALTEIYSSQTELAVWQRQPDPQIAEYAASLVDEQSTFRGISARLNTNEVASYISEKLPPGTGRQAMIDDLVLVCDMFSCLFELDVIGMRLVKLEQTMCPKLHCDQVPCRLLLSYLGAGTQYSVLPKSRLAEQPSQPPLQDLPLFAVALLKGQAWDEESEHGLMHRSPTSDEVYPRLLLSVDFAS